MEYEKHNFKEHMDINHLAYYMFNCDIEQFGKDLYTTSDEFYIRDKFTQFRDNFQHWLFNLDSKNRKKLTIAVFKFYNKNHNK